MGGGFGRDCFPFFESFSDAHLLPTSEKGSFEQVPGILSGLIISVLCLKQGQQIQQGIHLP